MIPATPQTPPPTTTVAKRQVLLSFKNLHTYIGNLSILQLHNFGESYKCPANFRSSSAGAVLTWWAKWRGRIEWLPITCTHPTNTVAHGSLHMSTRVYPPWASSKVRRAFKPSDCHLIERNVCVTYVLKSTANSTGCYRLVFGTHSTFVFAHKPRQPSCACEGNRCWLHHSFIGDRLSPITRCVDSRQSALI